MNRPSRSAFVVAHCIAACLAFFATGKHSYNYYILTRWAVFICCGWGLWRLRDRLWSSIAPAYFAVGILFNPLLSFHFARDTWHKFDIAAGLVLLAALAFQTEET